MLNGEDPVPLFNVGHWFVSCGFRWSATCVGLFTNHNAIEQIKENKNNKRKERNQIIYNIVLLVVVVSHQITKRQQYFIVSWTSSI
jgi:hypothetical protein